MSVRVMSLVFSYNMPNLKTDKGENVPDSTAKFVLLCLADHCNDDGIGAWPSIDTLCGKTSMSRDTVCRAVNALRANGFTDYDGVSKYGTSKYNVSIEKLSVSPTVRPVRPSNFKQSDGQTSSSPTVGHEPSSTIQNHPSAATPARKIPKSITEYSDDKPAKREPKPKDIPIAVQKFIEVRGKTPRKETWAMIQSTVGNEMVNLDFWKDVLVKYVALGWNPMNIDGALEWFRKKELPHTNGKDKSTKEHIYEVSM